MFNTHRSDDPNADLAANLEEAKQFSEYLKKAEKCRNRTGPRASELGMICSYHADKDKPDVDPERAPDIDITRTTTEASGSVGFGGKYAKNDKEVAALRKSIADEVRKNNPGTKGEALDKLIKNAQSNSIIKDVPETKSVGNVSAEGVSGALSRDVVVMRHKTGPDSGKITFVYTFSLNGSVGPGGQAMRLADAAGRRHLRRRGVRPRGEGRRGPPSAEDEDHHEPGERRQRGRLLQRVRQRGPGDDRRRRRWW